MNGLIYKLLGYIISCLANIEKSSIILTCVQFKLNNRRMISELIQIWYIRNMIVFLVELFAWCCVRAANVLLIYFNFSALTHPKQGLILSLLPGRLRSHIWDFPNRWNASSYSTRIWRCKLLPWLLIKFIPYSHQRIFFRFFGWCTFAFPYTFTFLNQWTIIWLLFLLNRFYVGLKQVI